MEKLLWQASEKRRKQSNLIKYHRYLKKSYSINFDYKYDSLFNWSIAKPNLFWTSLLSYLDINYSGNEKPAISESEDIYDKKFFPNLKLSYSENIINNLNSIPEFLKKITKDFKNETKYRVSVRASTKDRMPFFCSLETVINKNNKNEYLLGGLGSWGFVYAPLYAEFLVKSLLNEPLVINSNMERLLGVSRLL